MTAAKSRQRSANDGGAEKELVLKRVFDAPREAVFRAWTAPAEIVKWWGPDGCTAPVCDVDLRPGGAWRTCILSSDGKEHFVGGVYTEIEPPEKLTFTWAWETDGVPGHEMVVSVELHDREGSTELVLTQTRFESPKSRADHEAGWSSSLDCLNRILSGR